MRKNPDTANTLLVGALVVGGGYLVYRMASGGGKLSASAGWDSYQKRPWAGSDPQSVSKERFDTLWGTLNDGEKQALVDGFASPTASEMGRKIASAPPGSPTAGLLPKLMAMSATSPAANVAPAPAATPGPNVVSPVGSQASLPKGTSGFGDYHHGAY
jgi:hypothetical protein